MLRNSVYRRDLVHRATQCELIVKDYLREQNVRFLFQKGFLKEMHRIADFYIPGARSERMIIEIDGEYHTDCRERDRQKDRIARKAYGIRTLRITNAQVRSGEFKQILSKALHLA